MAEKTYITFNRGRLMEIVVEDGITDGRYECSVEELDSLSKVPLLDLIHSIEEKTGFRDSEVTIRLSTFLN